MDAHLATQQLRLFKQMCPFLARTSPATLRKMSTTSIMGVTRLRMRAQTCPILGPVMSFKSDPASSATGRRGYAKSTTLDALHPVKNSLASASPVIFPHTVSAHAMTVDEGLLGTRSRQSATRHTEIRESKCFNYEQFYETELDKKHQDKSYR